MIVKVSVVAVVVVCGGNVVMLMVVVVVVVLGLLKVVLICSVYIFVCDDPIVIKYVFTVIYCDLIT